MKKWKIAVLIVVALIVIAVVAVVLNLPKHLTARDSAYNLSRLSDGLYTGHCDNGIVKVAVTVDVRDNAIAGVRITEHQNGLGSPAEAITANIVERQSVELDAISGATMSTQTILKAVENALSGGWT